MFINISNHPSSKWDNEQIDATRDDHIYNIPFPNIPPHATTKEVEALATDVAMKVMELDAGDITGIMVQGEMTTTYIIVAVLQQFGYHPVAATTERKVVEHSDGSKTVQFNFVQFREYPIIPKLNNN